ncbi:MAG: hypothetical protein C5B45_05900 [Chlamydiae bacterium]|nr:MAG: hypothetical protein C5B45_05900 [Chlamydiota bacterium]
MLSNITYKNAACAQLYIHEQLQRFAQTHPRTAVPIAAFVSVADVATETVKHPMAAIENVAFSIINAGGSPCFKECNLSDAYQNIKITGIILGATMIMSIVSPLNLLGRLLVNLPDPENAHSCNKEIDEQANLPVIAYDSNERRDLLAAIKRKEGSVVIEKLLANNTLTHQSIGRALEDATENNSIDAVSILLTDPRLTKQSIGRALEKAAKNNHSEIMPLLIGSLIKLILAKYNQEEELSPLERKELQKDHLFINTCLSKAKKTAMNHDYLEMANHLNETAKALESIF